MIDLQPQIAIVERAQSIELDYQPVAALNPSKIVEVPSAVRRGGPRQLINRTRHGIHQRSNFILLVQILLVVCERSSRKKGEGACHCRQVSQFQIHTSR